MSKEPQQTIAAISRALNFLRAALKALAYNVNAYSVVPLGVKAVYTEHGWLLICAEVQWYAKFNFTAIIKLLFIVLIWFFVLALLSAVILPKCRPLPAVQYASPWFSRVFYASQLAFYIQLSPNRLRSTILIVGSLTDIFFASFTLCHIRLRLTQFSISFQFMPTAHAHKTKRPEREKEIKRAVAQLAATDVLNPHRSVCMHVLRDR